MKIGVLGAGHLGKFHLQQIKEIEGWELIGFYDPNQENAAKIQEEFGVPSFNDISKLIDACDALDIVTPTLSHFDCAIKALKKSKHVFIEKPVTNTVEEAKILMEVAREANVKVQVGHIERFNPAFVAAKNELSDPRFIETHRLAQFNPRGTDVSVVLDLMIHDIDIVLSLANSDIRRVSASGVAVISDTPDIANARIEFDNGCVANLTASRISLKNMRKSRFFQKDAYISVDFLEKKSEIVKMKNADENTSPFSITIDTNSGTKEIMLDTPDIEETNAIKEELTAFLEAIQNNSTPIVTLEDGYTALKVAHEVLDKMQMNLNLVQAT